MNGLMESRHTKGPPRGDLYCVQCYALHRTDNYCDSFIAASPEMKSSEQTRSLLISF